MSTTDPSTDGAPAEPAAPTASLKEAALEFLAQPRLAVVGVSRDARQPANLIYRRLRDAGHAVFAVNPNATEVEGDQAYPSVRAIEGGVQGAVIVTPPDASVAAIEDCAQAGVPRAWLHRGLGPGSSTPEAVARGRELGLQVIPGGCPNMFGDTADLGHRCMCAVLEAGHRIPREIAYDCAALEGGAAGAA